jgi:hypothetical protein
MSAEAALYHLPTIYQGQLWEIPLEQVHGPEMDPLLQAGFKYKLQFRAKRDPLSPVLLTLSTVPGECSEGCSMQMGELDGTLILRITGEATRKIVWTEAQYDLLCIYPDGTPDYFLTGKVTVTRRSTHA